MTNPQRSERRTELAMAITLALQAIGESIKDPTSMRTADHRTRAAYALVDAFNLAGTNTQNTSERPPTPTPVTRICQRCHSFHIGDEPCRKADIQTNVRGIQTARNALRAAKSDTPSLDGSPDGR